MEAIFGMLIVWAASYAIVRGTQGLWGATKRGYRRRADAWTGSHPAVSPMPLAAKLGAGIATFLTGGIQAARGFIGGWRQGWPEGRAKGVEWHQRREARDAAQFAEQATGPIPYIRREPATDVSVPDVSRPAGTETLTEPEPVPDRDSTAYTDPIDTTTEGTEPMATITSSTGGEVLTMDQLLRELNDIATDAASELEDAQADMKRAAENVTRFDNMVSSLEALDLDQATIADVGALSETAGQRAKAADLRAAAADAQLAQAETALKGVQSRHSLMQEAHAATPHAADKSFYQA